MATETEELLPILRTGTWVLLDTGSRVPKELRGRKGFITQAPVAHVQPGEGDASPMGYEKQDKDVLFLVRVPDTGLEHEFKRSAFAATADNADGLGQL